MRQSNAYEYLVLKFNPLTGKNEPMIEVVENGMTIRIFIPSGNTTPQVRIKDAFPQQVVAFVQGK
jgi:hypothetical protein